MYKKPICKFPVWKKVQLLCITPPVAVRPYLMILYMLALDR